MSTEALNVLVTKCGFAKVGT